MNAAQTPEMLDAASIPQFVSQLTVPPVLRPIGQSDAVHGGTVRYVVDAVPVRQQMLPDGFPATECFGYGGRVYDSRGGPAYYWRGTPGPTIEARRGEAVTVLWRNRLTGRHPLAVDPTLHWANPNHMPMEPEKPWPGFPPGFAAAQYPVPTVTHLHGGETAPPSDGYPEAWATARGQKGPAFLTAAAIYRNRQQPTTLWHHDHTLGMTRLNVYAGLAGLYLLRDPASRVEQNRLLPDGPWEVPLFLQDRSFYADGSPAFPTAGNNPKIHPYWVPGFAGNTVTVNGRTWPRLEVERRLYRLRLVNGSNERLYHLYFSNGVRFYQIGTDGGFLPRPAALNSLLLAPAERADLLVDFSCLGPGETVMLCNDAPFPYPTGTAPDPETTGRVMRFDIPERAAQPVPVCMPFCLNCLPRLCPDRPGRILTLTAVPGPNGPQQMLLDGLHWSSPVTETPAVGSTEDWFIVNPTANVHPVHLHLVQFLPVSRRPIDAAAYSARWTELNGQPPLDHPPCPVPPRDFYTGPARPPDPNERGWKDTIQATPGEVTRIRVRFAPQDIPAGGVKPGENRYPFRPDAEPGYVWHCHILDHEDNDMMRPMRVEL